VVVAQVLDPGVIKRLGSRACGINIGVAQELGPGLNSRACVTTLSPCL
jgi:hypothetical protein